jgi:lipopolysaccharide biosynthesis protein
LNEIYPPNENLFTQNKVIPARRAAVNANLKIAVHLHVFYPEIGERYFVYFDEWNFNFDLFITTDTAEKKTQIKNLLAKHPTGRRLKKIIIVENRGRDVAPWLTLAERLRDYEVVGKFHTKKSPQQDGWLSDSWQQDIFDKLAAPAGAIINTFAADAAQKIGVVLGDLPYAFRLTYPLGLEKELQTQLNALWEKTGAKKTLDFTQMPSAIVPAGTMFWYRPAALAPLFNLRLRSSDFPAEPFPHKNTLAHAIEYAIVYLAWAENYDYRITVPENSAICGFYDNITLNKKRYLYQEASREAEKRLTQLQIKINDAQEQFQVKLDDAQDLIDELQARLALANNAQYQARQTQSRRNVVYTCLTGDYDVLPQPTYVAPDYDYVCFTDSKKLLQNENYGIWKIAPLRFNELDNARNNRWHKTHPHRLFPQYEKSIYLDANVDVRTNYLFNLIKQTTTGLLLPAHFSRDCIYDEATEVLAIGKDSPENVDKILAFLRAENFPAHYGLNENNIIYRDHHHRAVIVMMELWWELIKNFSKRDQLSLSYVLWKAGVKPVEISFLNARNDKVSFAYFEHKNK